MYALKRRQKRFHDQKIISKEFQEGDLVLAYTLKQHTSKLTKRGRGPYVIDSLSPSGAIRLATLDGDLMANWISGCRLKKYSFITTLIVIVGSAYAAAHRTEQVAHIRSITDIQP